MSVCVYIFLHVYIYIYMYEYLRLQYARNHACIRFQLLPACPSFEGPSPEAAEASARAFHGPGCVAVKKQSPDGFRAQGLGLGLRA